MTNPHPVAPTRIDIRGSADQVIAQFQNGRLDEGLALLERLRSPERAVVQEALDRYVAAAVLRDGMAVPAGSRIRHEEAFARLDRALGPPRIPDYSRSAAGANELAGLSEGQKYDVYASMVETRGNDAAREDLQRNGHSVLLGLRRETSIFASPGNGRRGTGLYDDQIIVLGKTAAGEERIFIGARATTEPTAQYSHHAGSDGNRPVSGGRPERRILAPAPGYEAVAWRKIEGEDVDNDTMRDLGRMAEGTIEMELTSHNNPASAGSDIAFRPSPEQLEQHRIAGMVQRDTNADGYFTAADVNGVQDLNSSFKIHSGSRHNTDSAGCQTLHPDDYRGFLEAAQRNPQQTRWQYVLTSTQGGLFHNVEVGDEARVPRQPAPAADTPANRQGSAQQSPGPFDDPGLNRYYAAVLAGDAALANRIALGFAFRSPQVAAHDAAALDATADRERAHADHVHQPGAPAFHI